MLREEAKHKQQITTEPLEVPEGAGVPESVIVRWGKGRRKLSSIALKEMWAAHARI